MMTPESYLSSFYGKPESIAIEIAPSQRETLSPVAMTFEFLADSLTCVFVLWVSAWTVHFFTGARTDTFQKPVVNLIVAICVAFALLLKRRQANQARYRAIEMTVHMVSISAFGVIAVAVVSLVLRELRPGSILLGLPLLVLALTVEKHLLARVVQAWQSKKTKQNAKDAGANSSTSSPYDIEELVLLSTMVSPPRYTVFKRAVDFFVSLALILLLAPIFLTIAVLIRLTSDGPIFFSQERVGLGGQRFQLYKFRSMVYEAFPYETSPVHSRDPRITRIGRALRKTGLDELPQLLNVLSGEMSLVGPRPEMPFIVDRYTGLQRQRLQVLPGITGLWQLSAERAFPIHENLHHDFFYIRQQRLTLDMAILIHTLVFAMSGGI
jgi:lipopolysaccharide/colanic/teichoic acid biosynthesis glycosyltransferase